MFEVIHRPTGNKPHPGMGHGASTPNPLDISSGSPGTTTLRGNPLWVTPVPSPRTTLVPPPRQTPVPSSRLTPTGSLRNTPVPSLWPVPLPRRQHHQETDLSLNLSLNFNLNPNLNPNLSLNHSLNLLQYQIQMKSKLSKPLCRIQPQMVTQYPTMESSLSMDTLKAWEMRYPTTWMHLLCASGVERTITQRATAKKRRSLASTVRASNTHHDVVYLYLGLPQLQMGRLQTLPAQQVLTGEASKHTHQICPENRKRRSQNTKINRKRDSHSSPRHDRQMQVHTEHHLRGIVIHNHHPLANISILTHHHWVDTCIHLCLLHHSSIHLNQVRSSYNKILTLLLHSSRWLNSIGNTSRQVRTRWKPLRTLPVPHPLLPL